MKRIAFWALVFLAGGLLAPVVDMTLGPLWFSLGWRRPVVDWLLSKGLPPRVASYWSIVWIMLPDWAALVLVGAVIGRVARPGKWLRYALVVGGGFIAYSLIGSIQVLYWVRLAELDGSLAMRTFWGCMVLDLISLILLVLAAWLFGRTRGRPVAEPGTSPIAEN
ncbi:hypothetical protein LCGC14_0340130 [marine sediment metagenome]|uniref:Uncharacterized protein n=1 Tax=marine sediment metagenome TaxID=412755 RepID=A0A0F9W1A4_9ZZZZ|nr:hypothetical protein [Phycisphaerae bacterium]HDZ44572.1 hypothetical protein [Phycisphaerae bacterium]